MTTLKLHVTDLKARRKAGWDIAHATYLILMLGGATAYYAATGSSWYWWGMGTALTVMFAFWLVSAIRAFRKARTHYASVEELLKERS